MRRREVWALAGVLLGVAGLAAVLIVQPTYMDAYYYFDGALQLARGQGFREPYVWNYLAPVRGLPAPSHLYWMPLTSLAAAPFVAAVMWLRPAASNAELFRAAQIPMVAAAAGLAGLAGAAAGHIGGTRRHVWAGALLTVFSTFYFPFWPTTDSFALFGVAAGGALWLFPEQAAAARGRAGFLSGLLAGLAHLARADGVLVGLSLGVFELVDLWRRARADRTGRLGVPAFGALLGLAAGYLFVMSPWFLRNWLVVGAPLAPGGLRALWLTRYDDLYVFRPETLTLARYLAQGWGAILQSKWDALAANLQALAVVPTNLIALPFVVIGGWQLRGRPAFQRAALYGALLFLAMTFAFTYPGPRGGFFHSSAALLPFAGPAALVGLEAAVEAAARRLRHWQPEKSKPVFQTLLVAGVALLALVRFLPTAGAQADTVYAEIGLWLRREAGGAAVAAVNNPPGFYYHAGLAAIAIPADDQTALAEAMRTFGARWLVLDQNVVPELAALYDQAGQTPGLRLRVTFTDAAGRPVYLLEADDASGVRP